MHGTIKKKKRRGLGVKNTDDVDTLREQHLACARDYFWIFRLHMHPQMQRGWFIEEAAHELQKFYEDYKAGKRPKLVLMAPPQHGKSMMIVDFIAWCAGKNPDDKAIFASYSEDLGERANKDLQRIYDSDRYREVWFGTQIMPEKNTPFEGRYTRNLALLEYIESQGSFRNTTVNGQITGQSLDLGFIDDPLKGRAEASSKANRDKVWNWFTNDFFSRFSDHAAFLMIMTRWHLDDPMGRWLQTFGADTKVLRYPALAEKDEYHEVLDYCLGKQKRKQGTPLFPEFKSLSFLMERKKLYSRAGWESLYMQNLWWSGAEFSLSNTSPR